MYADKLTSFPELFKKSISSGVKLAIDIDFTLCGGFNPRLKCKTKIGTILHSCQGPF